VAVSVMFLNIVTVRVMFVSFLCRLISLFIVL
jgi:hypothetical protein